MGEIIAMGGGGFSMEPDNLALDRYILAQSAAKRPKICFLPTASGDADGYVKNFYAAFSALECQPSHFSLFRPETADIEGFIMQQDVIYVGGGNTRNLMILWREWGLDEILKKAYANGTVLSGISAGGICWFEQSVTDPPALMVLDCMGILEGSFTPHYDEDEPRELYKKSLAAGEVKPGYGVENSAALHFKDGVLFKSVCSVPGRKAFKVSHANGTVIESPLPTEYIGN